MDQGGHVHSGDVLTLGDCHTALSASYNAS